METYRRNLAELEGGGDSIELELPVDVRFLLLDIGGFVDVDGG